VIYQENGGPLFPISEEDLPTAYRIIDPRTGDTLATGHRAPGQWIDDDHHTARIVILHDENPPP
jgi:hypothetical protein